MFRDVKRAISEKEKERKKVKKQWLKKSREEVKKERRQAVRASKLPKNRVCPGCRVIVLDSTGWIEKRGLLICRSCASLKVVRKKVCPKMECDAAKRELETFLWLAKRMDQAGRRIAQFDQLRVRVDGSEIAALRESVSLTRKRFASLCGWSYTWQSKLETGNVITVSLEMAVKMALAFRKAQNL